MTGETGDWLMPHSAQPGGREPAPGELALVQAFINSHYDLEGRHGADLFETPQALRGWLLARGLVSARTHVAHGDLDRALAVREGLRELARGNGNGVGGGADGAGLLNGGADVAGLLNGAATGASVEVRFANGRPRFVPGRYGGVSAALGLMLALTAQAMLDGTWSRLKVCPGDDCGWAFYDHSRNQTGRWCSMSVCGGRAKARTHYRRRRRGD
jgi:predicted RNA-binding Zn ribbon-like protein